MFALRTTLQRNAVPAMRRLASATAVEAPKNKLVPDVYQYSLKKSWFSDPSTYPLIAVMTLAASVMIGMSTNALLRYKGVKIRPEHKSSIMRDYDTDTTRQAQVTEVITRRPMGFYADGLKSLRHEGLGVDHEAWKKAKEQKQAV